jgi:hypothetical protein
VDLSDVLAQVTKFKRTKECGRKPVAGAVTVKRVESAEGPVPYFAGLASCGSVWNCPCCSPKIRDARAKELERLAVAWIEAGHGLAMATLTVRHWEAQRLAEQFDGVATGWQALQAGRWWGEFRERHDLAGMTRAIEAPHGYNGWHCHIHALLWFERPLGDEALELSAADHAARLEDELYARWVPICERKKLGRPSREHGVKVDPVRRGKDGAADVARYVAKVQDKDSGVERSMGNELIRGDLKEGRNKWSRTPFEILRDFSKTGDMADLELWHEYEQATHGRRCMTWTRGLRDRLNALVDVELDERSDEEIAAEEVGGEPLVSVAAESWWGCVARVRGRRAELLVAAESGDVDDVIRLLYGWGVPEGDVMMPGDDGGGG